MPFKTGLPDTPVSDLWVEDNALAIATHGRSFYVMDNLATLRQFGTTPLTDVMLFKPAQTVRGLDRAAIDYYLKAQPKTLTIDFIDAKGTSRSGPLPGSRRATNTGAPGRCRRGWPAPAGDQRADEPRASTASTWDLNSQPVVAFPGMILWGATTNGPMVLPGSIRCGSRQTALRRRSRSS